MIRSNLDNKASRRRRIYDFFTKKWYLSSMLFTLSSTWFILLQFFGKSWNIINKQGDLEKSAIIVSIVFVFITLLFTLIKTLADKINEEGKYKGQTILNQLLEEINLAKEVKLNKYLECIAEKNQKELFFEVINPENQIKELFGNIQNTVSNLFGINKSAIGLSIIYRNKNDWEWLYQFHVENDLTLIELLNNPNTSARQVIDNKTPMVFYADKRDGIKKQEFCSGRMDTLNNNIGSIYCKDISLIKNGNQIMPAVFTLTTYAQQLCPAKDFIARDRIVSLIMPTFELRLRIELSLLFIRDEL